ncbi:hypothetical protein F4679DRAFT_560507 [Xylaria curta]|nr:hypothetical protein F4679DRAFT_560507 [Xylaria curta]
MMLKNNTVVFLIVKLLKMSTIVLLTVKLFEIDINLLLFLSFNPCCTHQLSPDLTSDKMNNSSILDQTILPTIAAATRHAAYLFERAALRRQVAQLAADAQPDEAVGEDRGYLGSTLAWLLGSRIGSDDSPDTRNQRPAPVQRASLAPRNRLTLHWTNLTRGSCLLSGPSSWRGIEHKEQDSLSHPRGVV